MFNLSNTEAIRVIREWLDDISYSTLNGRLMQFLDQTGQLYPDFNRFMGNIDRINPIYAFIFSIFRLGQPAERSHLDNFLPAKVVDALIETGLLINKGKYYQMPGVGIVTMGGMYFVSGLPEVYPTASRNSRYKPIDNFTQIFMDEMGSQPFGTDFLELNADYGILANMAAAKGFKNIQIQSKHLDCVPLIQLNLALNHHEGKIISDICRNKYDLIVCIYLSVKEKIEARKQEIANEKDITQLISVFRQLKDTGQAIVILESVGAINEITINAQFKGIMEGFNIKSVVLTKILFPPYLFVSYLQSSWEKQFELVPLEFEYYARKNIETSESKQFVFTQLLKINKDKNDEPFVLFPFYNPKYSDIVFNYASLTI